MTVSRASFQGRRRGSGVTIGPSLIRSVRMAAAASTLPEFPADITDSMDYVRAVAGRLAAFTNSAREAIDATDKLEDANAADLFTEVSRAIDKHLWFVEAHLQA